MGLGLNHESGNGGDIVPYVKYDARAGRIFRNDRIDVGGQYQNSPVDITRAFKAVIDMENVEVGYMNFSTGGAPAYLLVPLGEQLPHKPGEQGWKQGARIMMKLGQEVGGDNPVRELTNNSTVFIRGLDALHDAYVEGEKQNPGKLPVVVLKDTIPITSGQGDKKSTNYQPVLEIVGWVSRPKDLEFKPRARRPETAAAPRQSAPATGSTIAEPPAPKPAPAMAMADDEDFG